MITRRDFLAASTATAALLAGSESACSAPPEAWNRFLTMLADGVRTREMVPVPEKLRPMLRDG